MNVNLRRKKINQVIEIQFIEKRVKRKQKGIKWKAEKPINQLRIGALRVIIKEISKN